MTSTESPGKSQSSRVRAGIVAVALAAGMAVPASAAAWTVTVHVHGAGTVTEVANRFGDNQAQMNCTVSPDGKSESSPATDCVGGTANGLYNSGNIVRLAPSTTGAAATRGWAFDHWTDSSASGKVNCDPQDTTGDFSSPTYCEFQVFQNLEIDLYFKDTFGPSAGITGGPTGTTKQTSATFNFNAPTRSRRDLRVPARPAGSGYRLLRRLRWAFRQIGGLYLERPQCRRSLDVLRRSDRSLRKCRRRNFPDLDDRHDATRDRDRHRTGWTDE